MEDDPRPVDAFVDPRGNPEKTAIRAEERQIAETRLNFVGLYVPKDGVSTTVVMH